MPPPQVRTTGAQGWPTTPFPRLHITSRRAICANIVQRQRKRDLMVRASRCLERKAGDAGSREDRLQKVSKKPAGRMWRPAKREGSARG
eukprot:6204369-Pleurochrysis_carterae.AAC.2